MSFSFGFSGDDIEYDPTETPNHADTVADAGQDVPPPIPAQSHDVDELVSRSQPLLFLLYRIIV
jgi:protein-histidine N-methyltransferase